METFFYKLLYVLDKMGNRLHVVSKLKHTEIYIIKVLTFNIG